jgi:hypothetical protein
MSWAQPLLRSCVTTGALFAPPQGVRQFFLPYRKENPVMRKNLLIVAAIAATFAASCAHTSRDRTASRSPDGGAEAMFRALDKDNDGFISRAEAQGTSHERDFDALDTNRDGKLSREEHAAAPQHANRRSAASTMSDQRATAAPGTGGPGGDGGTQRY